MTGNEHTAPKLREEQFKQLICYGPLVAIDLIVKNKNGEVLVGLRKNAPAKGFFFVPGGRIYKNETLQQAFTRIVQVELGTPVDFSQAKLLGAFDHIYINDNFYAEAGLDTHYVTLGYLLPEMDSLAALPEDQHHECRWVPIPDLLQDATIHENTKNYFRQGT